jgi:hypothetical protein
MSSRPLVVSLSTVSVVLAVTVLPSDGGAQTHLGTPATRGGPQAMGQPTTVTAYAIIMGAGTFSPVNIGNALSFTLTDPSVQASTTARQVTTPGTVIVQLPATPTVTQSLMQQQASGAPFTMAINALNANGVVLLSYTLANARIAAYQMTYTGTGQAATASISYTAITVTPQQIGVTVPVITRPRLQAQ